MKNVSIYWDHTQGVVGVYLGTFGGHELRATELIANRERLSDAEILSLVDRALDCGT